MTRLEMSGFAAIIRKSGTFDQTPVMTGDWLNLTQLTLVWVLHL